MELHAAERSGAVGCGPTTTKKRSRGEVKKTVATGPGSFRARRKPSPTPKTYLALNNETCTIIAEKLDIDAAKLVALNQKTYPGLKLNSKFKPDTELALPICCPAEHHRLLPATEADMEAVGRASHSQPSPKSRGVEEYPAGSFLSPAQRGDQCVVCGENMSTDTCQEKVMLPCHHTLHVECLRRSWIAPGQKGTSSSSGKQHCPLCRTTTC